MVYSVPEAYSESWYIQNPDIIRTLGYLEPYYIRNPGIFRTLSYSELCQTSTMECFCEKKLTAIIIFMASAVQVLYCMKKDMTFLNPGLICIPEVITVCKVRDREFMNREFIQIN